MSLIINLFWRLQFFKLVKKVAAEFLNTDITQLLERLLTFPGENMTDAHIKNLFFGDYGKPDGTEKIYDEITDLDELSKVMDG